MLSLENYRRISERDLAPMETGSRIRRLVANLRSNDGETRRKARKGLVFIGKPAVGFLVPLLKDPDDDVRWEAAKAMCEIADPRAASDLVRLLMDHNFGVRWLAAEALISIGRDALEPLLEGLTKHPESSWLRRGALHTLHDLRRKVPDLKEVAGPVITALEGVEPEIACMEAAYSALGKIGGPAHEVKNPSPV
jgi:HEAT repeat protein